MMIIVIPAVLNASVRMRSSEIAIALGRRHRVIMLAGERQPQELSRAGKLAWHARQAFTVSRRRLGPTVTALRLPSVPRWPRLSRRYTGAWLWLLARLWGCRGIVNEGTGDVRAPASRRVRVIYDLLDNHWAGLELEGKHEAAQALRAFVAREVRRASAVTASSCVLARILKDEFGRDAVRVPNGAPVAAYRAVQAREKAELRQRLKLGPGPILGFTGGVDWWVDASFAVAVLRAVQREHPDAKLLVVGDGVRARELREAGTGVVVTGFVSPADVPVHVALFDVGLVPFAKNALTDAMLPIKIFDYGAARKPAVSTPLGAYAGEDLPFLRVAAADPDAFAATLLDALRDGWHPAWDAAVDRYDWEALVTPLEELLTREVGR